jgi:hypothetical protein
VIRCLVPANTANAAQQKQHKNRYETKIIRANERQRQCRSRRHAHLSEQPEVDAKIDAYIKENPKYWTYVQSMPRDRLERTVVLNEVREVDRQQRIREGVLKQINRNPELKRAYDLLVKDLPEDQKEGVIAQIGRQARRAVARAQGQSKGEAVTA